MTASAPITQDVMTIPRKEDATLGKPNLVGLTRDGLRDALIAAGTPEPQARMRVGQVWQWIYHWGVRDFAAMTNLAKDYRALLADSFQISLPEMVSRQVSADGTRKYLMRIAGGHEVETVYIPEADRGTLCISSQVGCALDCAFCSTAQQGLQRNLTAAEIVSQVWFAIRTLVDELGKERPISNVVFMGMGEPLANYNQVITAIRLLQDDLGFGLSKRRVTVSTSGLVPFMDRLSADVDTALAVSLHAPNDALRNELVPINRKYPIADLIAACGRYTQRDRKMHIVYEYVMLDGVNDSDDNARELARLLRHMPAKVNLIPFNPFPQTRFRRSSPERIEAFANILRRNKLMVTTRRTRGDDIDAACGQLVGRVASRQQRRLSDIPVRVAP